MSRLEVGLFKTLTANCAQTDVPGRRALLAALLGLFVSACVSDPTTLGAPLHASLDAAQIETVFAATNRARSDTENELFSTDRGIETKYSRIEISIPQRHRQGHIERKAINPDPARHMATIGRTVFDGPTDFVSAINASLEKRPDDEQAVFVYVHGFNNSFADSVYMGAQIRYDLEIPATMLQFSWPSAGQPTGYGYDKDSVLFSRDAFDAFLTTIQEIDSDEVAIVAHSMGTQLTMETLRQIAMRGDEDTLQKLATVILVSPDIDQDVFRRQIEPLLPLPFRMIVMISRDDRALRLAGLFQRRQRLGRGADIKALQALGIIVVDMSDIKDGNSANHAKFAEAPAFISLVRSGVLSPEWITEHAGAARQIELHTGREGKETAIVYFPTAN